MYRNQTGITVRFGGGVSSGNTNLQAALNLPQYILHADTKDPKSF